MAHEIARFPDKRRINDFVTYLTNRAEQLSNLTIHLNQRFSLANLKQKPDLIVNTTGALPLLPPIKGLHEELAKVDRQVFSIFDLLGNMEKFQDFSGKKVVVIGGGAVGLDVVEYYAENGAEKVAIVEMVDQLGKDLDIITKLGMMELVTDYHVDVHTSTKLMEVQKDRFLVESPTGKIIELPFDLGFICLGMRANAPLMPELTTYAQQNDVTLLNIGDSKVARRIMEGTREARDVVKVIKNLDSQRVSPYASSV